MPVRISRAETEVVLSSSGPISSSHLQPITPLIDEDDEVLQVIDVYLSPTLADQMHCLQYPLTQFQTASEAESWNLPDPSLANPSNARIKPQHGKIEIDVPLPSNMEREGSYAFIGDRTFQSQTIPIQTHLCLGKMIQSSAGNLGNPELHLVPLGHMKQMRPSFQHVDAEDQRSSTSPGDDEADLPIEETKSKPVVFQRKESDRAAMARKSSYAFKKTSEESEDWSSLTVCLPSSAEHKQVMSQVYCTQRHQQVLSQHTPQSTYIQSLHYISDGSTINTSTNNVDNQPHNSFAGNDIKSIVARVTSQMSGGGPIPYQVLRANFDMTVVTEEQLLKALSVVAVFVRGNFCLHNKFLSSDLPPDLARARTFVLLLLHREGCIERPRLDTTTTHVTNNNNNNNKKVSLSSERWLPILKHLAKQTSSQGSWVLKLDDDTYFEERFPEQASLYEQYWRRQEQRFQDALDRYHHDEILVM